MNSPLPPFVSWNSETFHIFSPCSLLIISNSSCPCLWVSGRVPLTLHQRQRRTSECSAALGARTKIQKTQRMPIQNYRLDLRIVHDRFGSNSDPILDGQLHYPQDLDKSLNETATDKIRKYRADYNNNPPNAISFMPAIPSTSGRLHSEFIRLLFLQPHRETDRFFAASGVQSAQFDRGYFHFHRATFSSMMKSKCGKILAKASALRMNLNLDGVSITSQSHTHPSHSQTSRLLTSSLSLGVPVPRPTQSMWGA